MAPFCKLIYRTTLVQMHLLQLYQLAVQKLQHLQSYQGLLLISSPITYRFSQFSHWHIVTEICDTMIINDSTTPQYHYYTTLWKLVTCSRANTFWLLSEAMPDWANAAISLVAAPLLHRHTGIYLFIALKS